MDFGFEGFESAGLDVELEDIEVKRTKKFDRMWGVGFGGSINNGIRLVDGITYFGAMDSYVYAVDVTTGREVWRFKTSDGICESTPAVANGVLYIGSFDHRLYALDTKTGKFIWSFRTGGMIDASPEVSEGIVYFGSKDGNVYAVDCVTGNEVWRFRTGDEIASAPTVYGGMVFNGSFDKNFYCLDKETGKEIWRFRTGGEIHNDRPFLAREGRIYFTSFDSHLYCADVQTGKEIWRFKTGKYGNAGSPAYHDGIVYHGSRDGIFYAIDDESGKELWRFRTERDESIDAIPLIHNNRIYIGAGDSNFYCLDMSGREVWRYRASFSIFTSAAIFGNAILFTSMDCHLYALDLDTGEERWRFATSTLSISRLPPPYESFRLEVSKSGVVDHFDVKEKYKKGKSEVVSLSDYHVSSEYATTSEYKQKSDYDVQLVIIGEVSEMLSNNTIEEFHFPITKA
jgi:outer membrane protein assembly factor BamB